MPLPTPDRAPVRRTLWQVLLGVDDAVPEGWHRPRPGWAALRGDLPLAALVVGLMVLSERMFVALDMAATAPIYASAPWAIVAVPVAFFVALALRRVSPLPAMLLSIAAFLVGQLAPYGEFFATQIACFVGIYSAAAWSRKRVTTALIALVVLVAFIVLATVGTFAAARTAQYTGEATALSLVFGLLINVLYVTAAAVFGANDHRRAAQAAALAERTTELAERTAALEAERRVVAEQAVRLDRVEIARELHDVVAHHVSLMGLQAAAARRSLAASPERAERALLGVEDSARTAIAELQQLLTTLRADDAREHADPASAAATGAPSTQSIEQLPELVGRVRDAGLAVSLHEIGAPRPVSRTVGFTLYRIAQEALTNAQKHAGADAEVDVRVRWRGHEVELDVTSRPPAGRRARPTAVDEPAGRPGRGLCGMRERALAVGGTVEAGPRPEGGFRVLARLPAN